MAVRSPPRGWPMRGSTRRGPSASSSAARNGLSGRSPTGWTDSLANQRNSLNPLGLYELLDYRDISVIKGSGLGGTSLINANVAIVPGRRGLQTDRVAGVADPSSPVAVLPEGPFRTEGNASSPGHATRQGAGDGSPGAENSDMHAMPLDIAVNFDIEGTNEFGVEQQKPARIAAIASPAATSARRIRST